MILLQPAHLTFPLSPEQLFERSGPLVLEIGFGDGRFIANLAQQHPSWNIIGVEISPASVTRAYKRFKRKGITSAIIYPGHANFFVRNMIPPDTLDRIYVNFPDPWPKLKEVNKRLLQKSFFELTSTRLKKNGSLLLTTDHKDYFQYSCNAATQSKLFKTIEPEVPKAFLETKYARKWKAEKRKIYHAVFKKTGTANPIQPNIEIVTMQHAIMSGNLNGIKGIEKEYFPITDGFVLLLDAYRSMDEKKLTFLVSVDENELHQEMLIEAKPNDENIYVGLKRFGNPITTKGAAEAVRIVVEWLERSGLCLLEKRF